MVCKQPSLLHVLEQDEKSSLVSLPGKLQMDIALDVHIETLRKVHLFHDCEQGLIHDLVLKLKPVLFLPGDLVCTKVTSSHQFNCLVCISCD